MKKKDKIARDPVVAEIRAIRARMWQEAGGTPAGFLRLLDREIPRKAPRTASKDAGAKKRGGEEKGTSLIVWRNASRPGKRGNNQ